MTPVPGFPAGAAVADFELNLEGSLLRLQEELQAQTYQPGRYHNFTIYEPKRRLVSAAPFRDRVVHHAVCQVIEPIWEARFIHHSYALHGDIVKYFVPYNLLTLPTWSSNMARNNLTWIKGDITGDIYYDIFHLEAKDVQYLKQEALVSLKTPRQFCRFPSSVIALWGGARM